MQTCANSWDTNQLFRWVALVKAFAWQTMVTAHYYTLPLQLYWKNRSGPVTPLDHPAQTNIHLEAATWCYMMLHATKLCMQTSNRMIPDVRWCMCVCYWFCDIWWHWELHLFCSEPPARCQKFAALHRVLCSDSGRWSRWHQGQVFGWHVPHVPQPRRLEVPNWKMFQETRPNKKNEKKTDLVQQCATSVMLVGSMLAVSFGRNHGESIPRVKFIPAIPSWQTKSGHFYPQVWSILLICWCYFLWLRGTFYRKRAVRHVPSRNSCLHLCNQCISIPAFCSVVSFSMTTKCLHPRVSWPKYAAANDQILLGSFWIIPKASMWLIHGIYIYITVEIQNAWNIPVIFWDVPEESPSCNLPTATVSDTPIYIIDSNVSLYAHTTPLSGK